MKNIHINLHDPATSEAFLDGRLNEAQEQDFVAHLEMCGGCRRTLEAAAADLDSWREAQELLSLSSAGASLDASSALEATSGQPPQIQSVLNGLTPTDDPQMLGRIGPYEVSGVIGAGGMGVVLKAVDKSLDRIVAIKVLAPHLAVFGAARGRFAREARAAAAVLHPNVIAIHSVSSDEALPYIVMPYIRGSSLERRLDRQGPMSVANTLRIGAQVAAGLAAAHAQGLVHRDIKPANILLEEGVERVTITDFGLARAIDDASITHSGVIAGTPQYMSPEQARGEPVDGQSDLFSLGSVMYATCTARPPFRAETTYGVLRRIIDDEPTSIRAINAGVPVWLEHIVKKLMAKSPVDRFSSAAEVEALLKQCLAHVEQPLVAELPPALFPPKHQLFTWIRNPRTTRMTLTALTVAALSWLALLQLSGPSRTPESPQTDSVAESQTAASTSRMSTKIDNYKIELVEVADVSAMTMTTEYDLSRMKVQQQFQQFDRSVNGETANATTFAGVSGGAGGSGGGFGAVFNKPNLGIALKIEPIKQTDDSFVKLSSKATAITDRGEQIESKDLGPTVNRFAQFEARHRDAQFLYLHQSSGNTYNLKRLEGELLITPGRRLAVAFDGIRKQKKTVDKQTFSLQSVKTSDEGIQLVVAFPPSAAMKKARTPQEKFEALLLNRGARAATIEDNEGDMHPSVSSTNVQSGVQHSFTVNGSGIRGAASSPENPSQTFSFAPLPAGRKIKSIHVSVEDRTGEPAVVPFLLEREAE